MTSKVLDKYLSKYGGINDLHLFPLKLIKNNYLIEKVLYPGCWIHLTPSLIFSHVVYVDFFSKMESILSDPKLLEYIGYNSEDYGESIIKIHNADYRTGIDEEKNSFDLLISLSSGFVSKYCGKYLKKNGVLLVNNEHYDAMQAFVDDYFSLVGVFTSKGKLIQKEKLTQSYFETENNEIITSEMVLENSKKPPSKVKYKLKKRAPFYLFKRSEGFELDQKII